MAQRRHPPPLEVRESFEKTTRFSPQCLIDAYTRLVPIRRKTVPRAGHDRPKPTATVTRRGGEHG